MKKNLRGFYFYVCTALTSILWGTFLYRVILEDGYFSPTFITITILFAILSMILFILIPNKRLKKHGDFIISFPPHNWRMILHISLSLILFIIFIWATFRGFHYRTIQGGLLCIIFPQLLNMNYSYHAPAIITSKGILQGFFFSSWDKFHEYYFKDYDVTISATLNRSDTTHCFKFKATKHQKSQLEKLLDKNTNIEVIS